jgi:hypothetical protein
MVPMARILVVGVVFIAAPCAFEADKAANKCQCGARNEFHVISPLCVAQATAADADQKTADLNLHDNRGTAALLAEAGATAPEIAEAMTWTVDKAQRIIDAYLTRPGE